MNFIENSELIFICCVQPDYMKDSKIEIMDRNRRGESLDFIPEIFVILSHMDFARNSYVSDY